MSYPKLEDCTEIESIKYLDLKDPKFVAQTRANENKEYWMVFESEGTNYKIKHKL